MRTRSRQPLFPPPDKLPFTDCTQVPFEITIDSDAFIYDSESGLMPTSADVKPCASIRVHAIRQGHATVTASYIHGKINLKSTITIAAFDPLVVSGSAPVFPLNLTARCLLLMCYGWLLWLQAADPTDFSVIAIGSMREIIFKGGPAPWVLDSSQYFAKGIRRKLSIGI